MSKTVSLNGTRLHSLFNPEAIAVIGASRDATKWGGRVIVNLQRYGFEGLVIPVNPTATVIHGLTATNSISDLPYEIDLAVVAVPAALVEPSIRELGERRAKHAIVLTSGFAELGEKGRHVQERVRGAAREAGVTLCGPNSVGIINVHQSLAAAATSAIDGPEPLPLGGLSLVSQSGAVGLGSMLSRARDRGIGLAKLISTGNEADLTSAEIANYLAHDDSTDAIGIFLEGVSDGRRLLDAIGAATAQGKPVAVLKAGRSRTGAAAAATHTGLLAGEPEVFQGAVTSAGATWCQDLEDLLDSTRLTRTTRPRKRIAVMSTSGGINTLAADLIQENGLKMARLTASTVRQLTDLLPEFNPVANPLDVSGQVATSMDVQYECLRILRNDPGVDAVVIVLTVIRTYGRLVEKLTDMPLPRDKSIVFVNTGGNIASEACQQLALSLGYPVFESLASAVKALANVAEPQKQAPRSTTRNSRTIREGLRTLEPGVVDDGTLLQLLSEYEVPFTATRIANSRPAIERAFRELRSPLVVKALARDASHKAEHGLVELNVTSVAAANRAMNKFGATLASLGRTFGGVVIQEQREGELEVLIGGRTDVQFGPVVTLAWGGVLVNALQQAVTRPAPLGRRDAEQMLRALPRAELLDGYRTVPPLDTAALRSVLVSVSRLVTDVAAVGFDVEFDLNPVFVNARGDGVIAVDGLCTLRREDGRGEE